ncbi:14 kDa phosphohistidine phosphatase-like isoform X2 [Branchiostoma floridae]|uniref:14 kDa phosphohistidine phosphatase n=1 Tax=Branchiostoma floridae TaxID=7739 RepID=A0A9J7LN38_BRAFL|nr:14 kDa phosphohistidine phosphatase-like isoform X2 [Branchiostoma floridae]
MVVRCWVVCCLMFCAVRSFALSNASAKCVLPVVYSARQFLCELRQPSLGNRTTFSRQGSTMSAEGGGAEAKLAAIPDVEIDPDGKFKYILIRCHGPGDVSKDIVRGFAWAEYHDHIYGKVKPVLDELQIQSQVLGGGKITHESAEKKIHVYGKSTGFGQADHSITVEKLKKKFPDYSSITFNNEGY